MCFACPVGLCLGSGVNPVACWFTCFSPPYRSLAREETRMPSARGAPTQAPLARRMPSPTLALGLLGLALGLAASWLTLPCPHYWAARELRVLRMGANASSAATEHVQPTLGNLLGARSLGSLVLDFTRQARADKASEKKVEWYIKRFLGVHFSGNLAWGHTGILKLEMEKAKDCHSSGGQSLASG